MSNVSTPTEERALSLLSSGIQPEQVAGALGVSASYISQLISNEEFAKKLAEAKFQALAKHNEQDDKYDAAEAKLMDKFTEQMEWGLTKPMEILKSIQILNSLKRRGASAPTHITQQQTVVQLFMPAQIVRDFTKNSLNQVVKAGDQELITIQSGQMATLLNQAKQVSQEKESDYVQIPNHPTGGSVETTKTT